MAAFDYTAARFTKSNDGLWKLDRDWTVNPATQLEAEALFAHTLKLDRIVGAFVRHFACGDIVAAEGLDEATTAELRGFYAAASAAITPPPVGQPQ